MIVAIAWQTLRGCGIAVLVLLLVDVMLGVPNVLGTLPLPVVVGHNWVAALLLAALVMLNFAAYSASSFR